MLGLQINEQQYCVCDDDGDVGEDDETVSKKVKT